MSVTLPTINSYQKVVSQPGIPELWDGNTRIWLDSEVGLTESSGAVSAWEDIVNGHVVLPVAADGSAGTSDNYPSWTTGNGVVFDGVNDAMRVEVGAWTSFGSIYAVVRQISWTYGEALFGYSGTGGETVIQKGTNPELRDLRSSGQSSNVGGLTVGSIGIIMLHINAATPIASLSVNNGTPGTSTSAFTGYVSGGIILGAMRSSYPAVQLWGNLSIYEIIYRDQMDNGATVTAIYNYLADKYL